jgi:hypothetical protein
MSNESICQCKKAGGNLEVNLMKSRQVFEYVAFATSRLSIPDSFSAGHWLALDQGQLATIKGEAEVCQTCAPTKPHVRWTMASKGNRTVFVPIEDGQEAAVYERALKQRPHPWIVRLNVPSDDINSSTWSSLTLSISCNASSLVQRGLGLFQSKSLPRKALMYLASKESSLMSRKCTFEWRVVPHVDKVMPVFPKLTFTSNKQDNQANQPPGFDRYPLRLEQLRSLKWMLKQESTTEPFIEEELTEAVLPSLNWRAEGRVRRPVLVRGGIIADEV